MLQQESETVPEFTQSDPRISELLELTHEIADLGAVSSLAEWDQNTAMPSGATEVRGHFADVSEWLASVLSQGAKEGVFQLQGSPRTEALALLASVHGAMLSARAHDDPELFVEILRPVLRRLAQPA